MGPVTASRHFSGQRLRELRKQAGHTSTEFAYHVGVGHHSVLSWESGHTRPSANYLPRIVALLDCDLADLYGE